MPWRSPKLPPPLHPRHWFPQFLKLGKQRFRSHARLMGLSLVVGVIAGLGAVTFYAACQVIEHYALGVEAGYYPAHPGGEHPFFKEGLNQLIPWLLPIIPAVGGLLCGLIVYTFAPEAEGHGTDAAITAYHYKQGVIRPLVPIVKILASAITLGTGGSGGREGPIAQIGAGFGSFLGGLLRLRPTERRLLLAAGMGAGIAAIFRAPLAGALFAAEVMYRSSDFESEAIIPAALGSVTAYCTFGLVLGWGLGSPLAWKPLFEIPPDVEQVLIFNDPLHLISYTLLAFFMVILAMLYVRSFYGLTYQFRRLPIKPHFRPMIGGCLTGAVALALVAGFAGEQRVLGVLSFGYGVLQEALQIRASGEPELGLYMAGIMLAIAGGKILTTSLTIGSGGSGGVFGPSMVIGGCGGGALGIALHYLWPDAVPHPGSFVIVGMAGFFAAAAKTPVSTLIMVGELTGNYNLLLPTLWVCALAFLLADEQSIYSSQAETRSLSPVHQGEYVQRVLAGLQVRQFLKVDEDVPVLHPGDTFAKVVERLSNTSLPVLPVTDVNSKLLGVINVEEALVTSLSSSLGSWVVAADLMRSDVVPLQPDDRLDRALEIFVENDLMALPVVESLPERRVIGVVKRADIATAYLSHVHAPHATA